MGFLTTLILFLLVIAVFFYLKHRGSANAATVVSPAPKKHDYSITNTETGEVTFHNFQKREPVDMEETRLLSKRFWTDYYLSPKPRYEERQQYILRHKGREYVLAYGNGEPHYSYSRSILGGTKDSAGDRELKIGSKLHKELEAVLQDELSKIERGELSIEVKNDGERGKEAYLRRLAEIEAKKLQKRETTPSKN